MSHLIDQLLIFFSSRRPQLSVRRGLKRVTNQRGGVGGEILIFTVLF